MVPSVAALQGTSHIQAEVDRGIRHLTDLNEAGNLKSQRGGVILLLLRGRSLGCKTVC